MDEQREKLLQIFDNWGLQQYIPYHTERAMLADFILDSPVLFPSVNLGQMVYSIVVGIIHPLEGEVYEITNTRFGFVYRSTRKGYFTLAFTDQDIGKAVFFTREEAHEAIAKRKVNQ